MVERDICRRLVVQPWAKCGHDSMISESCGGSKYSITCRVSSTKLGIPEGNETPAPQRNTTRPVSQRSKRISGMEGPSGWNLMSSTFLSVNVCLDSTIHSHVMNTGNEKTLVIQVIHLKVNDMNCHCFGSHPFRWLD